MAREQQHTHQLARAGSRSEHGHSVVEIALIAPWIFFMFVAVVDIGFYCYAATNIENAARSAALRIAINSANATNQAAACNSVVNDVWMLRTLAQTPFTQTHTCGAGTSLVVSVADPAPGSQDGVAGQTDAVVTVQFNMLPMIPAPGITGNFSVSRTARVRVNSL